MTDGDRLPRESASDDATHTAAASAATHGSADVLAPGMRVDRFILLERIGEGGMGSVWAAYDGELDRKIALKLVLPERAGDAQVRARMLREAQALARLSHPNVVAVHEVGVHDEQIYVAMEHVEGETLKAWLLREPVGATRMQRLLEIMRQAGRGLLAAHAADMVHRDFKPSNVIVGTDGRVRVVDFGLARVHAGVGTLARDELVTTFREDALRSSSGDGSEHVGAGPVPSGIEAEVTEAGTFVGTPRYMAPEQFGGKPVDPRADQFSFCTVMFEGVFGRSPWSGTNVAQIHAEMLGGPPKLPSEAEIPPWLRTVLRRGLSPKVGQRYVSMEAVLDAITPTAEGTERARGRRRWLGAGAVSLTAVSLAAWAWLRSPPVSACEATEERILAVWSEAERDEVGATFRATGVPYAEEAVRGVTADLDRYARLWTDAATSACLLGEQSEPRGQSLAQAQGACLELRLGEFGQVVALLREADGAAVESALDTSGALIPASRCARPGRDEGAVGDNVMALRLRLANARAMTRIGRRREAAEVASVVAEIAERQGALGVRADAILLSAELQGNESTAARLLDDAFSIALTVSEDEVALAAAIASVDMSVDEAARDVWRRRSGMLLQRIEARPEHHARHYLALGRAADRHGQSTLAEHYLRSALVGLDTELAGDGLLVTQIRFSLAVAAARSDPGTFADASFALALEASRLRFGTSHPHVGRLEMALGLASAARSDNATAIRQLRNAVAIFSSVPGRMSMHEIEARRGLGEVLVMSGQRDLGFEELLRAHSGLGATETLLAAMVYRSIGTALILDGQSGSAIPVLTRGFDIERGIRGEQHSDLSVVLNRLAVARESVGDLSGAIAASRLAADLLSRSHEYASTALQLANLAVLTSKTGEHSLALTYARRAVDVQARGRTIDSRMAFPLRLMALQLLELDRPRESIAPLERALALHGIGNFDTEEIPKTQLALARALWDGGGDRQRAHALASSARATLAQHDADSVELVETDAWLRSHPLGSGPTG